MNLGKSLRQYDASPSLLPADLDAPHPSGDGVTSPPSGDRSDPTRPVIGWRIWHVVPHPNFGPWVLRSPVFPYYWTGPTAWLRTPPSFEYRYAMSGSARASLGFHLWRDEAAAKKYALIPVFALRPVAYGACEVNGRVIEHELGYRAQGVVIRRLSIMPGRTLQDPEKLRAAASTLERIYDCDVAIVESSGFHDFREYAELSTWSTLLGRTAARLPATASSYWNPRAHRPSMAASQVRSARTARALARARLRSSSRASAAV